MTTEEITNNPIILFDGVCNLCESSVNFIIKRDIKRLYRYAPIQSESGKAITNKFNLSAQNLDSFILIENEKCYIKSEAALQVIKNLPSPWKLLLVFRIIPLFIRDKIYDFLARNRYNWFGAKKSCMIPTKELNHLFLD